ncbi:hypothetical protein DFH28DRAFT_1121974 [Melampsora americana]|nr:hypothetical protein DFH28DRAFT_1121974 [Melampsora americana]
MEVLEHRIEGNKKPPSPVLSSPILTLPHDGDPQPGSQDGCCPDGALRHALSQHRQNPGHSTVTHLGPAVVRSLPHDSSGSDQSFGAYGSRTPNGVRSSSTPVCSGVPAS